MHRLLTFSAESRMVASCAGHLQLGQPQSVLSRYALGALECWVELLV